MKNANTRSISRPGMVELKNVVLIMVALLMGFVSAVSVKSIQKRGETLDRGQQLQNTVEEIENELGVDAGQDELNQVPENRDR